MQALSQPDFWDQIKFFGVNSVDLYALESSPAIAEALRALAEERGICLIGHPFTNTSSCSADFELAIRAYKSYVHLFHLIKIERSDWPLLPHSRPFGKSSSKDTLEFPIL